MEFWVGGVRVFSLSRSPVPDAATVGAKEIISLDPATGDVRLDRPPGELVACHRCRPEVHVHTFTMTGLHVFDKYQVWHIYATISRAGYSRRSVSSIQAYSSGQDLSEEELIDLRGGDGSISFNFGHTGVHQRDTMDGGDHVCRCCSGIVTA